MITITRTRIFAAAGLLSLSGLIGGGAAVVATSAPANVWHGTPQANTWHEGQPAATLTSVWHGSQPNGTSAS